MSDIRYYAGLGCRRGCTAAELEHALMQALQVHRLRVGQIAGLATIDTKRDENGLRELARRLDLPLQFFAPAQLAAVEHGLSAPSAAALRAVGVAGVAEQSALAAAAMHGAGGALLGPKYKTATATCAIACLRAD